MSRPQERDSDGQGVHQGRESMTGMMAAMMAMCAATLILVLVVLPALGYPLGLIVVFGAVALMFWVHARLMNNGGRR